jgi:hypothetical protein
MESRAVSEVKGVTLTMDLREAMAFLEDPGRAQDHVRGQLVGHGLEVPQGNGKPRRKGVRCDRCEKVCSTERGLQIHVARMHPETLND